MSDENIKLLSTSIEILNLSALYVGTKARVKFNGGCLKQEKILFDHGKIVNTYTVYKIDKSVNISSYSALENCLFGAVRLTEHVDECKYSGYSVWYQLDRKEFVQLVTNVVEM